VLLLLKQTCLLVYGLQIIKDEKNALMVINGGHAISSLCVNAMMTLNLSPKYQ